MEDDLELDLIQHWFGICSGEFQYLGKFKTFEEAERYAVADVGELCWLINESEARRWKRTIENSPSIFKEEEVEEGLEQYYIT